MPYIKESTKTELDDTLLLNSIKLNSPGELAYVITKLCLNKLPSCPKYSDYAEIIGVIETVKLELYRRIISPYEDIKIKENGDVF